MPHTPGPWSYGFDGCDGVFFLPEVHASANSPHGASVDREEDARLIATAPDLLAACKALLKAGEEDGRYLAICQQDEWVAAVRLAIDAIARAEGR